MFFSALYMTAPCCRWNGIQGGGKMLYGKMIRRVDFVRHVPFAIE
jgi:hypothetical protein